MTLLQQRDQARRKNRRFLYDVTRQRLREALAELLPGREVVLFGSLTRPGAFNDQSDIDLALVEEPRGISVFSLLSQLEERLERSVDVVLLEDSRFREKILREGETWTV